MSIGYRFRTVDLGEDVKHSIQGSLIPLLNPESIFADALLPNVIFSLF